MLGRTGRDARDHPHHHRSRRRHLRSVAGLCAGAGGPSRAPHRGERGAVRACGEPLRRRDAGARARGGDGAAAAARAGPRGRGGVACALSAARLRGQPRGGGRARPSRARPLCKDDARARRASMQSGCRSSSPSSAGRFPSALFFADEAHMPAPAALEFMLGKVCDAGVEVVFGVDRAPGDRRYGHRLPRTCRARRAFRSARRARRAPHRAIAPRSRCAGRCSSCTRASRSTSCRGATAAT